MRSLVTFGLFGFLALSIVGLANGSADDSVVAKVRVQHIEQSAFSADVKPPKDSYLVVAYAVLDICAGELVGSNDEEIKVAHYADTAKDLQIGEELCIRVRPTGNIRTFAKYMLEDFGVVIPEESIADFSFAGEEKGCCCY